MFELKPLSESAIPRAMAKAERYRLLNEPQEADSICRDILSADPDNQEVLAMLLLSITDQFARGSDRIVSEAHQVLDRLSGEYERAYYSGIVCERWVKAQLKGGGHTGSASGWFLEALQWYQKAQLLNVEDPGYIFLATPYKYLAMQPYVRNWVPRASLGSVTRNSDEMWLDKQ